jgi:hypothetical protein
MLYPMGELSRIWVRCKPIQNFKVYHYQTSSQFSSLWSVNSYNKTFSYKNSNPFLLFHYFILSLIFHALII